MVAEHEWTTPSGASRWVFILLALIFLLAMHLVFANTGGSGADLPQALLVWSIMLLLIAGCAFLLRHQSLQGTAFSRTMMIAALLLTLPWCWSPSTDWQLDAFPRIGGLWAGMALYILLLNSRLSAVQKHGILWFMVIASVMQAVYCLVGIAHPAWLPEAGRNALIYTPDTALGVFQQRNVSASFIATGGAILLWMLGDRRFIGEGEKYRRLILCALIILIYTTLTLLKSRTGWLAGLGCWLLFSALFTLPGGTPRLSRGGVLLAPAAGIALGIALMSGTLSNALQEHDTSTLHRLLILQETWRMIEQHPLLGWGYGGYSWSFAHFLADRPLPLSHGLSELTHPHNEVLFWWVEGGIVALAGLALLLVSGLCLFFGRPSRRNLALLGCLLPILLHTQLEYPLYQSPVHWLMVLILLSFVDMPNLRDPSYRPIFTSRTLQPLPYLIAALALGGMLLTVCTFWQGQTLTGFQQSPADYANRVLALRETLIGTERLRRDKALSWIVHFQSSGNVEDLQQFSVLASRWLETWQDADIYHNLINVKQYTGHDAEALQLRQTAHRLYPEDTRFLL